MKRLVEKLCRAQITCSVLQSMFYLMKTDHKSKLASQQVDNIHHAHGPSHIM